MSTTTRREALQVMASAGVACLGIPSLRRLQAPVLNRTIPSSGEKIPAVGLGSWITFNVGDDVAARNACADVVRTFVQAGGALWQLEPWLPGQADTSDPPSDQRLAAAMESLAQFHEAAAKLGTRRAASPGLQRRWKMASELPSKAAVLRHAIAEGEPTWRDVSSEILERALAWQPLAERSLANARRVETILQSCIREEGKAVFAEARERVRADMAERLDKWRQGGNVTVHETPEDIDQWKARAAEFEKEYFAQHPEAADFIARVRALGGVEPDAKRRPCLVAAQRGTRLVNIGQAARTAASCHSPGTPLSCTVPRSTNSMPEPATRSATVLVASTSPASARAPTRAPMCTPMPL